MTDKSALADFHAFDAAVEKESSRGLPETMGEARQRLSALIDLLPQRHAIEDRHATRWLDRCMTMATQRLGLEKGEENVSVADVFTHVLWHVRRASAIGGSEIGTVVRHWRGETGGFSNARNLVLEKLLILAPQPGDDAMNRGVIAEPWIQKMYLEEADAVSDEEALDALKGYRWDAAPYMVGTPDDLIIRNGTGERRITDYKCPSEAVNAEYEKKGKVSFDYFCQVHHYAVLAKRRGIKFDGMDIVCHDPRSFKRVVYEIEMDVPLVKEMLTGASKLWNEFVMRGLVPEKLGPPELVSADGDINAKMQDLTMQATMLKVAGAEIEKRKEQTLEQIEAVNEEAHALSEGKVDLGFANFVRDRKWDSDVLINLAEGVGLDPEDYLVETKKFDAEAAKERLQDIERVVLESKEEGPDGATGLLEYLGDMVEAGMQTFKRELDVEALVAALEAEQVDVTPAMLVSQRFSLSRAKKHKEKVEEITIAAVELADILEEMSDQRALEMIGRAVEEVAEDEYEDDREYDMENAY